MATKFRKGQRVVCIHYKDRPICIVDCTIAKSRHISGYDGPEVYVRSTITKKGQSDYWWGPPSWFKAIRKKARPIRKPKAPKPLAIRGLVDEGSLCGAGLPGCTCNQTASVGQ